MLYGTNQTSCCWTRKLHFPGLEHLLMDRAAPLALCCLIRVVTGSDYFWLAATTNRPLGIRPQHHLCRPPRSSLEAFFQSSVTLPSIHLTSWPSLSASRVDSHWIKSRRRSFFYDANISIVLARFGTGNMDSVLLVLSGSKLPGGAQDWASDSHHPNRSCKRTMVPHRPQGSLSC